MTNDEWCISQIDPEAVKLVKEIVEKTGAEIVLSSSWRGNKEKNKEFFKQFGLEISDETTRNLQVTCNNEILFTFRGLEIDYYLSKHHDVSNYVIIDDDSDMLLYQKDYFVKTDYNIGIQQCDVDKAINILNK